MKNKLKAFLLFALIANTVAAQKYSNEFLNIGTGARAQGMGNAHVAITDDVTAGYWNPAGLMQYKGPVQIGLQHSEMFAGITKYDYLGAVYPLADSMRTVGLSVIRFGVDNIPNTLSLYNSDGTVDYSRVTQFSAADYAVLLSYAQRTGIEGLTVGGNAKIIHRTVGQFAKAWGFGLDGGVQYRNRNGLRLGAMVHDLTTTFNAWSFTFTQKEKEALAFADNVVPIRSTEITRPKIVLGFGYQKQFGKFGVTATTDLNITTDGRRNVLISAKPFSIDPYIGLETSYNDMVFLRGGVNNFQKYTDSQGAPVQTMQPNIGVGIKLFKIRLDYAYTNVGNTSLNTYSHVISLIADLNFNYFKNAIKIEDEE